MMSFSFLFDAFEDANESLFIVGGFCRDFFQAIWHDDLAKSNGESSQARQLFWEEVRSGKKDVDFATSARPEKTVEILKAANLPVIPIGFEFGTIQTIFKDLKVEITTFRSDESYKKGSRKPSVVFGNNLKDDLQRRDFSVNSMAMDRDFNIIDPFGGQQDSIEGGLWTPGDPKVAFTDDPLRMLRACRFHARGYWPSHLIGAAMEELAPKIRDISIERVFEEITKILVSEYPEKGLKLMADTGLLKLVLPEIHKLVDFKTENQSKNLWEHTKTVVKQCGPDPILRWAALFHDVGKPDTVREEGDEVSFHGHEAIGAEIWENVSRWLKVGNDFRDRVKTIIAESGNFTALTDNRFRNVSEKAVRRFMRKIGKESLDNIWRFTLADMTTSNEDKRQRMQAALTNLWKRMNTIIARDNVLEIKLPTGFGIQVCEALGIKPGPELGIVMKMVLEKRISGELTEDDDLLEAARRVWIDG